MIYYFKDNYGDGDWGLGSGDWVYSSRLFSKIPEE